MNTYESYSAYPVAHHHQQPLALQQQQPAERHVLVERYKTKPCRNYIANGFCPYEVRCMFAHGDHELRTPEMNLRDGLITEEAIKAYQRVLNIRNRNGEAVAAVNTAPALQQLQQQQRPPAYFDDEVPTVVQCIAKPQFYTHNPYAVSVIPRNYASSPNSSEDCECVSCAPNNSHGAKRDPNVLLP